MAKRYRVLRGIDYTTAAGAAKRAEPGDVVEDVQSRSVKWMVDSGVLAPVEGDE